MPFKKTKKVTSIAQIIERLSEDTADINGPIWYRGQCNKKWTLTPLIYRSSVRDDLNEMHLLKNFKQDAISLFEGSTKQSHEWLFIMRHYGIPTRLLDWTESPLVATYFASESDDVDGSLWMILPLRLNKQDGREFSNVNLNNSLPSFEEDKEVMDAYQPGEALEKQKNLEVNPIAFICPRNIPRMKAQRSVYTIHHIKETPIEKIGDRSHIWRYIIPKEAKPQIRNQLSILGLNEFQLFPEAEYIGKKLIRGCMR